MVNGILVRVDLRTEEQRILRKEDVIHNFEWNPNSISRFWDAVAAQPTLYNKSFSALAGADIASFVSIIRPLKEASMLDYGCGRGFLIPHLFALGARVSAAEHSPSSVDIVNEMFKGSPLWDGAKLVGSHGLSWDTGVFDMTLAIEVVEHVTEADLSPMLNEMLRVLKPEGFGIFTTPHQENLSDELVHCPNCSVEYHRWQHLRSWSPQELRDTLTEHGFDVVFCRGIDLASFHEQPKRSWQELSIKEIKLKLRQRRGRILDRLDRRPFPHSRAFNAFLNQHDTPHLVAVARKPC